MTKPSPTQPPPVNDDCVVPWGELIRLCGAPGWNDGVGAIVPEAVTWAATLGVTIRRHWTGAPGLSPTDAHRARVAHEKAAADHAALNAAYREHTAEQKRQAAQARREAEARMEEQAKALEGRARERQLQRAAEEATAAVVEPGHGVVDTGFEKFKQGYLTRSA